MNPTLSRQIHGCQVTSNAQPTVVCSHVCNPLLAKGLQGAVTKLVLLCE